MKEMREASASVGLLLATALPSVLLYNCLIGWISDLEKTIFYQISKHIEVCHKYSVVFCTFNSLLGVWIFG